MSNVRICDHCKQAINDDHLTINGIYNKKYVQQTDYHIDCFNRKFSTEVQTDLEGKE